MTNPTLQQTMDAYLLTVANARSPHTARAYANGLRAFVHAVQSAQPPIDTNQSARNIKEEWIGLLAAKMKDYAAATSQLYLSATASYYRYLVAEGLAVINLPRVEMIVKLRGRKLGKRLPQFPKENIERVIAHAIQLGTTPAKAPDSAPLPKRPTPQEIEDARLRDLRDAAFILTLADTGLRVHEACGLRRGDVDAHEGQAVLIGKGNQEAVVRFSSRALAALHTYQSARAKLDGASGKPLQTLPLFARHDKGTGGRVMAIGTATGRNIVKFRVGEALSAEHVGTITPHSFRHYFVTTVLVASGGNLKLAQELARHKNIAVTQRYAHLSDTELDKGYHAIFEQ